MTDIDYEKETFDAEELSGKEIKINPGYLLMRALMKIQEALTQDEIKSGFLKFIILSDHVEKLAASANMLPNNYKEEIKKAIEEAKIDEKNDLIKQSKETNIKLGVITKHVFSSNTLKTHLRA